VGGGIHTVKVIGGGAKLEKGESGELLPRIRITAEVDGVWREYTHLQQVWENQRGRGTRLRQGRRPQQQRGRRRKALSAD
jgi:hypothetical protein